MQCVKCKKPKKREELRVTTAGYVCNECATEEKRVVGVSEFSPLREVRSLKIRKPDGSTYIMETDLTNDEILNHPDRDGHQIVASKSYRSSGKKTKDEEGELGFSEEDAV